VIFGPLFRQLADDKPLLLDQSALSVCPLAILLLAHLTFGEQLSPTKYFSEVDPNESITDSDSHDDIVQFMADVQPHFVPDHALPAAGEQFVTFAEADESVDEEKNVG
jgi:hypothetical protein